MFNIQIDEEWGGFHLPPLGQRIIKTTIAVFLCLVIYRLRGYGGKTMPTESAITAIICMQPYAKDSREYSANRMTGTLIGAVWGLLLLLLLYNVPFAGGNAVVLYTLMALGVLVSLYSSVLLRVPDASGLAAIVFLCVVIAFPDIENPMREAGKRILDVFIGTSVAIIVNVFRLPRTRDNSTVFFIRAKDLVADRFSHISPVALFRLNYLYDDGARICIMSEHAPAFLTLQMNSVKLNTPLIVMDGAAVYDPDENEYLHTENLNPETSRVISGCLAELGTSSFIYTVHNNKTCIFHRGEMTPDEALVYGRMKSSPYRSYLEGEIYDPGEIVYFKIIAPDSELEAARRALESSSAATDLRCVIRPQAGKPGLNALYVYSASANIDSCRLWLMESLNGERGNLNARVLVSRNPYRSERDAVHLLNRIEKLYEPTKLSIWLRQRFS